jgi:nucleoside-diphosphate-sugar epimerase
MPASASSGDQGNLICHVFDCFARSSRVNIGVPFTLNISRARRELGYQPVVSWQSGIAAMQTR